MVPVPQIYLWSCNAWSMRELNGWIVHQHVQYWWIPIKLFLSSYDHYPSFKVTMFNEYDTDMTEGQSTAFQWTHYTVLDSPGINCSQSCWSIIYFFVCIVTLFPVNVFSIISGHLLQTCTQNYIIVYNKKRKKTKQNDCWMSRH